VTRRLTPDELADQWVQVHAPDVFESAWPGVDEGRTRGAVSLTRAEVLADLANLHERPPLPTLPDGPRCSHCDLAQIAIKRTQRAGWEYANLCRRCQRYLHRHGELPSPRLNQRHRRRLGA
jgi:hypothetical protein